MPNEPVVGVYLERNGGLVMRAIAYGPENGSKIVEPTHFTEFDWPPQNVTAARKQLREMAKVVAEMGRGELRGISIASYGPFASLKRSNSKGEFGLIRHQEPHSFDGLNLREIFYQGLVENGSNRDARMTIHTDAEACAIGEAVIRGTPERHTLIFVLLTEGVGMGICQGRRPLASALHAELGMLHVTYDKSDRLLTEEEIGDESGISLAEVASNIALRKRYAKLRGMTDEEAKAVTNKMVAADSSQVNWELRARYLAQACLACTVMFAPHLIVIGNDLESNDPSAEPIDKAINDEFRNLMDGREKRGQGIFSYEELADASSFISRAQSAPWRDTPTFRTTGALGLCYAAANSAYGVSHPIPTIVEPFKRGR